ncbi:MAG: UPF0280 family protein [Candidatus Omnitrophota bacterium]|jgi:ApbE superfamily uncharacterized protein (UPF0280 family)|nr:MAG: UPF0280 family protein [Candidatus Omnitrophota bacterium]
MKTRRYQKRIYRDWVRTGKLKKTHVIVQETDLAVYCDTAADPLFIEKRVRLYRRQIEGYIAKDRRFLESLRPVEVELRAPPIVKNMAAQAKKANVGPMAAVAGAIAEAVGKDLLRRGHQEVIVENGGDIFLKIKKPRLIGFYAGVSRFSGSIALKVRPADTPEGICASSGTVGHSLSFGCADSVAVISKNAALADAVATACANLVCPKQDLSKAVAFARSIKGIKGVVIITRDNLASWGNVTFSVKRQKK